MPNAETARLIASLELKDNFTSKLGGAERALGSFDSRLSRTEGRAFKAGQQIGTGIKRIAAGSVALAIAGGGVFAKALNAASDLNETVSKVGVVFGKNAKQVLDFGNTSAAALGLSENAALSAAGTYGNLFVSLGLSSQKAAGMSVAMVKLAGDLASFNNASPEDTLLAIQAGLVGETEPLRKYGINLNDATLRQEALRLGLTKTVKEVLPPAIKAQAAYSLILKQSGTAQGDFARTSGGMANQIRILKANFTDMLATLAAPALPKVAKIFQAINKAVKENQPAIAALGDSIAEMFSDENIKTGTQFIQGAFETAKETAPIIASSAKATFGLVQGAVGLFKSLPPEIQKLAVGAFAVNKLTGGLVTNIAGGIIETVGKQFLQRGGTPANPLFVSDVTGGLGKAVGAIPGAAAATGAAAVALPVAVIAAAIAAPIVAQQKISSDQQIIAYNLVTTNVQKQIAGGASLAELKTSLAAVDKGILEIRNNPLNMLVGGQALDELIGNRAALENAVNLLSDTHSETVGIRNAAQANSADTHSELVGIRNATAAGAAAIVRASAKQASASTLAFRGMVAALRNARGAKDIAAAIKASLANIFTAGKGGSGGAANVLSALKSQLKNTHDPALQRTLTAAINRVEHKLAARQIVEAQLKKADQIFRSNRTNAQKIEALKHVQQVIGNRNAAATKRVQDKIDAAKRAQTAAQNRTTAAVNNKDLSVAISNAITVVAKITNRDSSTAQAIANRYYKVPT